MNCSWLINEATACGAHGEPWRGFVVCTEHLEAVRARDISSRNATAVQSAQYHDLGAFPGHCYFALLPDGKVKIGYSNTDDLLRQRFASLTRKYGATVVPLAVIEGGFVAEAVMHERFKPYRLPGPGERFEYSAEMADFLVENALRRPCPGAPVRTFTELLEDNWASVWLESVPDEVANLDGAGSSAAPDVFRVLRHLGSCSPGDVRLALERSPRSWSRFTWIRALGRLRDAGICTEWPKGRYELMSKYVTT